MSRFAFALVGAILLISNHAISEYLPAFNLKWRISEALRLPEQAGGNVDIIL